MNAKISLFCLVFVLFWSLGNVTLGQGVFDDFEDGDVVDDGFGENVFGDDSVDLVENSDEDMGSESPAIEEVAGSAVVRAIRSSNPQTPEQLVKAVDQLIRLYEPAAAGPYLTTLLDRKLDAPTLERLHREFGTAVWLRMSRSTELAPEGRDFAASVVQAARRSALDRDQIQRWVGQLSSDERREQFQAGRNLLRSGAAAVGPLVTAMAESPAEDHLQQLGTTVLRRIGVDAISPLIAELSAEDIPQRRVAMRMLGQIDDRRAIPYLIGPALLPDSADADIAQRSIHRITGRRAEGAQAVQLLALEADRAYHGILEQSPDVDGRLTQWIWDSQDQSVVPRTMDIAEAAALAAARLYLSLNLLDPADERYETRYWVSRLVVEQGQAGWDAPISGAPGSVGDRLRAQGASVVNRVLEVALQDRHPSAAQAAAAILGDLVELDVLFRDNIEIASPLVQALTNSDSRVRLAAAKAILKLNPPASFDGAGRLADVLVFFATSVGQPAVITAHPRLGIAQEWGGMLGSLGFAAGAVSNGRDLLRAAYEIPDLQFVVISDALNDLSAWDVVEQLRVDPKSAHLAVAIVPRSDSRARATRTAIEHERVIVLPEAFGDSILAVTIPRLVDPGTRGYLSDEQRQKDAEWALRALAKWINGPHSPLIDWGQFDASLIATLDLPNVGADATAVLSQVGTPQAQTALIDLASQPLRPLKIRQEAAAAFTKSVERFGILLSQAQIVEQYGRYNESRVLDQATQVLLGSVLDAIEARTGMTPGEE